MTYQFKVWPAPNDRLNFTDIEKRSTGRTPSARHGPRVIAHWQRGPDGRLECRWVRPPD
jgi:hypothetical protein